MLDVPVSRGPGGVISTGSITRRGDHPARRSPGEAITRRLDHPGVGQCTALRITQFFIPMGHT